MSIRTQDPAPVCMGDGPYGVDQCAPRETGPPTWFSPDRKAVTESTPRGWKKLAAISPGSEFRIDVIAARFENTTKFEIEAVDGNGGTTGDLAVQPTNTF